MRSLSRLLGEIDCEKLKDNIFPVDKDYYIMAFDFTRHNWIERFCEYLVDCYHLDVRRNFETPQGEYISEDQIMDLIQENVSKIEKEIVWELLGFYQEFDFSSDFSEELNEVDKIALKQGFEESYSKTRDLDYLLRIFRSVKMEERLVSN